MNRAVWKYPLEFADVQTLTLPLGAEILAVSEQGERWMLWALVTPAETRLEPRVIAVFGTGYSVPPSDVARLAHLSTFTLGPFIWHAFEVLEP